MKTKDLQPRRVEEEDRDRMSIPRRLANEDYRLKGQ